MSTIAQVRCDPRVNEYTAQQSLAGANEVCGLRLTVRRSSAAVNHPVLRNCLTCIPTFRGRQNIQPGKR